MSIYVDTNTIKVAVPGVNAQTAGEKDLVLSIGSKVGQVLATGRFGLSTDTSTGAVTGSGSFGPFDRTPELIGYAESSDGRVHYPAAIVTDTQSLFGPAQPASTFVCTDMTLDSNGLAVTGFANTDIGAPAPQAFVYLIFRKPFRA